jgi:hypothetical protein
MSEVASNELVGYVLKQKGKPDLGGKVTGKDQK